MGGGGGGGGGLGGDLGPPTGFDGVRIVSKFFVTTGAIGTIILGSRKLHIYPKVTKMGSMIGHRRNRL